MGKPEIPTGLAIRLHDSGLTWKEVSGVLKREGFPPSPFPAFQPSAIYAACNGRKKRKHHGTPNNSRNARK